MNKNLQMAVPIAKPKEKEPALKLPKESRDFSWLKWFKWPIIIIALFVALYFCMLPVRAKLSSQYVQKGDEALSERKYLTADLQYRKALLLKSDNTDAQNGRELAAKAATDPTVLDNFYQKLSDDSARESLLSAEEIPSNEIEAVKRSKSLIESGDFQLAVVSAKIAVDMNPEYRDGWVYLGISQQKAAGMAELTNEARQKYTADSELAFAKVKEIDPKFSLK